MPRALSATLRCRFLLAAVLVFGLFPHLMAAQGTGTVTSRVTRSGEGSALASVSVTVQGTGQMWSRAE
jgi:hypothetical protein